MIILADTINADSQSKNGGTIVVAGSCGGTATWTNFNNTKVNDGAVATASNNWLGDQFGTRCLRMTNFSFSIPLTATINGIELNVKASDGTETGTEGSVSLNNNSIDIGNTLSGVNTFTFVPPSNAPLYTYGSPTDLWGLGSINPLDVNNRSWGFDWGATNTVDQDTFNVQYMNMTVYYTNFTAPSFCDGSTDCVLNCSQVISNKRVVMQPGKILYFTNPGGVANLENNVTFINATEIINSTAPCGVLWNASGLQ